MGTASSKSVTPAGKSEIITPLVPSVKQEYQSPKVEDISKQNRASAPFLLPPPPTKKAPSPVPSDEDIRVNKIIYIQSLIRRWRTERIYERAIRRSLVAKELLETETNYVANLRLMVDLFAVPLQDAINTNSMTQSRTFQTSSQMIISESEHRTLFSSASVLLQFQQVFLESLKSKVSHWNYYQTIGDSLSELSPYLRIYKEYIGNYTAASELYLSLVGKTPFTQKSLSNQTSSSISSGHVVSPNSNINLKFKAFLEVVHQDPRVMAVGDLDSFMVQPIQRLPRYRMYLEQLVRFTPKNHEDYHHLVEALSSISSVVEYLNEKKRSHEQESYVLKLFENVEPPIEDLITPGRALLLEGNLQYTKSMKESRAILHGFLFNDILLLLKPKTDNPNKFKLKERYNLIRMSISEVQENGHLLHSPGDQDNHQEHHEIRHNVPCYYCEIKSESESFFICLETQKEADKWRSKIIESVKMLKSARETNPTTTEAKAAAFRNEVNKKYLNKNIASPQTESTPNSTSNSPNEAETPKDGPKLRKFAERKRELGIGYPHR